MNILEKPKPAKARIEPGKKRVFLQTNEEKFLVSFFRDFIRLEQEIE